MRSVADTLRVDIDASGRISGEILACWRHPFGVLGGYVAALALTAAARGVPEPLELRAALASFPHRAQPGPVSGDLRVLRSSGSVDHRQVTLEQGGRPILTCAFTFGAPSRVHVVERAPTPPSVPGFDDSIDISTPESPFLELLETRIAETDLDTWISRPELLLREWYRYRQLGSNGAHLAKAALLAILDLSMGYALTPLNAVPLPGSRRLVPRAAPRVISSLWLEAAFHARGPAVETYLVQSEMVVGAGDVATVDARAWDETGRFLATGRQQLLIRAPQG